jgi:hypothetical protein
VQLVTLEEARDKAREIRRQARGGGNPFTERRQSREVPTFKSAATQVHAEHGKSFKNAKHKAQWLASLETDVFPVIGDRPINLVDTSDVLTVLTKIWTVKPETARPASVGFQVHARWSYTVSDANPESRRFAQERSGGVSRDVRRFESARKLKSGLCQNFYEAACQVTLSVREIDILLDTLPDSAPSFDQL